MPNCLRTAMKRMMTTPMANSSIPWIPMTSGWGGEAPQGQACKAWPGNKDKRKSGPAQVNPDQATQRIFSRGNQQSVWLVGDSIGLVPVPGESMRTRAASWMKAALKSTLMLKWKICGSRHIWKMSLSRPMRENGGCVTSHLLE